MAAAGSIILSDPKVDRVLVNIFGGILRCDVAARGIVMAFEEHHAQQPLVVRMLGTNLAEGKNILARSGLNVTFTDTPHRSGGGCERRAGCIIRMGILLNEQSRVLVQGITGREGSFHGPFLQRVWHAIGGRRNPRSGAGNCSMTWCPSLTRWERL